jgi:peptidoglycan/xylan/chitin deacetylase (PgdA/CDA1 family)
MYHRVTVSDCDPWSLAVTPRQFAEHLTAVRSAGFEPMRLTELVNRLLAGKRIDSAVAVTFDDGYADNLFKAAPLLERHDIPATVFVTSQHTLSGRGFWWDALSEVLTADSLPKEIAIPGGNAGSVTLDDAESSPDRRIWRVAEGAQTARQRLYLALYDAVRGLRPHDRDRVFAEVREALNLRGASGDQDRPLSPAELVDLTCSGLLDVGSHSAHHPELSALSIEDQEAELQESRRTLESILGRAVTTFSYPFGAFGPETPELVRAAQYTCACTTEHSFVDGDCNRYRLPRVMIRNWDGDEFVRQLRALVPVRARVS